MDSLVTDWLNENSLRAYPLKEMIDRVSGSYTLDDGVILDAQLVYTSAPTVAYLETIVADPLNITFTVTGLDDFIINRTATFPAYIRRPNGSLLVVGDTAATIPDGVYSFSNVPFEPSVSHEFGDAWLGVQSLTFNSSSALTGDINFIEGYQYGITINNNVVNMNCGAGYGVPLSCTSFGASSDCSDIVSYVNGVGPDGKKILHFRNGGGIVVFDDPPNHRIFIGLASDPNQDTCKTITGNPAL
jgi:hypothetical protein